MILLDLRRSQKALTADAGLLATVAPTSAPRMRVAGGLKTGPSGLSALLMSRGAHDLQARYR